MRPPMLDRSKSDQRDDGRSALIDVLHLLRERRRTRLAAERALAATERGSAPESGEAPPDSRSKALNDMAALP